MSKCRALHGANCSVFINISAYLHVNGSKRRGNVLNKCKSFDSVRIICEYVKEKCNFSAENLRNNLIDKRHHIWQH